MMRKSAAILSIAIVLIAALIVLPVFALAPLVWLYEACVVIIVTAFAETVFTPPALLALTSSLHLARSGLPSSSR